MPGSATPQPPHRSWRRAIRRAVRLLLALSVAVAWGMCALAVAIVGHGAVDQARQADVIIVLGGGQAGTERRAEHGVRLFRAGIAPHLICSGGYRLADGRSEAGLCADLAQQAGVPPGAITVEDSSLNTEQNARHAAEIVRERGWQRVVVVSDDFHLLRARWMFYRADLPVWTSPAPRPVSLAAVPESLHALLREMAALGYYGVCAALSC